MKGKVTFNKSGLNSLSGKVIIPSAYLQVMGITPESREIEITCDGKKIIIEKIKIKGEI